MEQLAPSGPVYQAGTLSGNPLATAAGLCVLGELTPDVYPALASAAAGFASSLASVLADAGLVARVPVAGPLVGLSFGPDLVTSYAGAKASAEAGLYPGFMHGLLDRGVAIAPGAYEVLFPSLAHTPADYERAVAAAGEVAAELTGR
jgi:glutamate-1-semialdehyde 2,1-aminomutase